MALEKITALPQDWKTEPDNVNTVSTADEIKQKMMDNPEHIVTFLDTLIDTFNSTTDDASGADNVAATAVTDLDGETVQALIESIRNNIKAVTDGASGADFVAATGISGLTGATVQALLEALKDYIDTHKSSSDHDSRYYTETESNNTFATKQELQDAVLGDIPDNTLTDAKMATDVKIGSLATLTTTEKGSVVGAINEIDADFVSHLNETTQRFEFQQSIFDDDYNYEVISKDADDNIIEIHYTRADDTLFRKVEASNPDADGNYQTLTMTEYEANGTTVKEVREKHLVYVDGRVEERTKWVVV